MPPPPAKWKGKCEFKQSSLCNNKLIGARSFNIAEEEPFDIDGHGTHTASTAAGAFVSNADTLGNARGTAAGIAPAAHLAIYKVDCAESDILAGLDAAIRDGVDVLSISMDIIGPGANILAAWPFSLKNSTIVAPTFNIISGTSMSCPHLSGVAALLKSSHPSWSPAAIKSAMMTTTDVLNMAGKPIVDVFATGSGHVNPTRANNPGLIYDIKPEEYISYLCGLGYTDQQVEKIVRRGIKCGEKGKLQGGQLNYPSFSVALGPSQTFSRSVTNVGASRSVYVARINPPYGVLVTVRPPILKFSQVNQLATYAVTFTRDTNVTTAIPFGQGSITWNSDNYSVRSPISVTFQ
ncbi:Subtilisin-like protease 4 [Linum perenne]